MENTAGTTQKMINEAKRSSDDYAATIIIPCYNKEKYIARALDSIIELSRFNDFEVIVVDDCSTDGSVEIIQEYADRYDNIELIAFEQGSGSPSKPRNVGIERSHSNYLIFMDPDDKIINDGYSVLLNKMEEYQSDILIATRVAVNTAGVRQFTDYIDERFTFVNQKNPEIMLDLLNRRPFILKTIYSKKLIMDNNIRFNENIRTSEDESFDMKCASYAEKITKINDIVYQYTSGSENSLTTAVSLAIYEELYDVMKELESAYCVGFSSDIAMDRIVALVDVFYIYRMTYMPNGEEIKKACDCIYDAFERFGIEKFDCLMDRRRIDLVDAISKRDITSFVYDYFFKRLRTAAQYSSKQAGQLRNANRKLRMLKRKSVKPAVALANTLDKITQPFKRKPLTEAQIEKKNAQEAYKVQFEAFITSLGEDPAIQECNGYWLFMDRPDNAKDNAEALYRYVMTNGIHDKIAFLLYEDSIDYQRLKAEGFNIVPYASLKHWQLMYNAEYLFTSHCDGYIMYPWYYIGTQTQQKIKADNPLPLLYKLVFLQHGVIRSNLSSWLGGKPFYKFIASAPYEARSLLGIPHYRLTEDEVCMTGLARWDNLVDASENTVAVFPTWRQDIAFSSEEEYENKLKKSLFFQKWVEFCNSEELQELAKNNRVVFYTHHDNMKMVDYLKECIPADISAVSYSDITSFSEIVSKSKMLITDYSSFSFDFLYLNKPVLYYDFGKNAAENNIKGMEYGNYGYYCPELDDALAALRTIIQRNFEIEDCYRERIEKLFPVRDGNHCAHIIEATTQGIRWLPESFGD